MSRQYTNRHLNAAISYSTHRGTFYIRQHRDGRWYALLEEDGLGSYLTPQQARDDLVGGHTFSPSNGCDTSKLGLPEELSGWSKK